MLSIGWPEMMLVAAAALIIVGPRDLPRLLKNIGNIIGKVRRMGNDFKSEINKVTALDEIKDIKTSITQPLTDTKREIEQDFNKITDFGVEPTGAIKPKDPDATDVYDEIKSASAKTQSQTAAEAAKASMAAAVTGATIANAKEAEQEAKISEEKLAEAKPAKSVRKSPAKKTTAAKTTKKRTPTKRAPKNG